MQVFEPELSFSSVDNPVTVNEDVDDLEDLELDDLEEESKTDLSDEKDHDSCKINTQNRCKKCPRDDTIDSNETLNNGSMSYNDDDNASIYYNCSMNSPVSNRGYNCNINRPVSNGYNCDIISSVSNGYNCNMNTL